jgi:hypothetical protein
MIILKFGPKKIENLKGCFIAAPILKEDEFKWPGILISTDDTKGRTLKASKALKSGLLIPYGGVPIAPAKARSLSRNAGRTSRVTNERTTYGDYLVIAKEGPDGTPLMYLDGHERKQSPEAPKNAWIGCLVCEPSSGERAKAELVWMEAVHDIMPQYPFVNRDYVVCVELKEDIPKGTEITAVYNASPRYCKTRGYKRGLDCDEPYSQTKRAPVRFGRGNRSEKQVEHSLRNLRALNKHMK